MSSFGKPDLSRFPKGTDFYPTKNMTSQVIRTCLQCGESFPSLDGYDNNLCPRCSADEILRGGDVIVTLGEFSDLYRRELEEFCEVYKEGKSKTPKQYPDKMIYSEWLEQFNLWLSARE